MTDTRILLLVVAAAFAGALVYGRFAVAKERWRRIKRDTKAQWRGLKTLWKMLRRAGRDMAVSGVVVLFAVALAIYVLVRSAG